MNASNADQACEITPFPPVDVYKNDEGSFEERYFPSDSIFFQIAFNALMLSAWVYLIVKAYIDFEANRAELLDNELRNEDEGDHTQHELFNNANDADPDPANGAAAVGPGQQQPLAAEASASTEDPGGIGASRATRQTGTSGERRRRPRSNDPSHTASDLDEASPVAAAESVQGATDVDGGADKPKNPLRHVRKYARVLNPDDVRSKEPETSDEDLVPSREFKAETRALRDECQSNTATVAIATQTETLQVANNIDTDMLSAVATASQTETLEISNTGTDTKEDVAIATQTETLQVANNTETVLDDCDADTQPTQDVPAVQPERREDSQVIPSKIQQPLENDQVPPRGSNTETRCLKRIAIVNRHGTSFNEDLIAEAAAGTEWTALRAAKVTRPAGHRIIESLNARLLDQLSMDLAKRMATQTISDERLRQEIEVQARARYEAQRCYAEVVEQVRWFGLGWESARRDAQKEDQGQDHQSNRESTDQETTEGDTAADPLVRPADTMP